MNNIILTNKDYLEPINPPLSLSTRLIKATKDISLYWECLGVFSGERSQEDWWLVWRLVCWLSMLPSGWEIFRLDWPALALIISLLTN